jgi:hypothetical protein
VNVEAGTREEVRIRLQPTLETDLNYLIVAQSGEARKAEDQLRFAVSPLHCSIFSTRHDVVPVA